MTADMVINPVSVSSWLGTLPEPYRGKALANLDPEKGGGEAADMEDALTAAFEWAGSNEGFQFWDLVSRHYSTDAQVDLPDPDLLPALNGMVDNASWRMSRIRSLARAITSETDVIRIKEWVREMVGLV